jgi:multidrug efflux pump subunit AcrA (membrane-fusion protein)
LFQVPGAVVAIEVKACDVVKAGQVLARIDTRAAEQNVAASDAQVQSARATLEAATKEFEHPTSRRGPICAGTHTLVAMCDLFLYYLAKHAISQ